jgi:cell wall-associated NlpC family hydrolase
MRGVIGALASLGVVVGLLGTAVVGSAVALFGVGAVPAATKATSSIPPAMLELYQQAAATCPGLPWTVLAAIGTIESDNGRSSAPGVHSGANAAGAEGPMQFEPSTFAAYGLPVPPGGATPPSPYDPVDAVYAAARLLCANHSSAYVADVLALAQSFGAVTTASTGTSAGVPSAEAVAVAWALAQIGTPYVWGGETPGVGFDCSGLVQAAYKTAGVSLPRVAQAQYDDTTRVPAGSALLPGDLVFFGSGPAGIDHVGLFVGLLDGRTVMVDAPHSGADVRADYFPSTPGAAFGSMVFVGATRP